MIGRNGLRQLGRTPVKTVMFLLLFTLSVLMVVIGGNLWLVSTKNMERFEKIFTTIGTVEQKYDRVEKEAIWDWEYERNWYVNRTYYDSYRKLEELNIEGITYLSGPERRPFYTAYAPDLKLMDPKSGIANCMILEGTPDRSGVPAGPIRMNLTNMIYTYYKYNSEIYNFCDHNNPEPEEFYQSKTYVMSVTSALIHHFRENHIPAEEYIPGIPLRSDQADKDGKKLENDLGDIYYEEVTENFYETEEGKRWQALAKASAFVLHSIPVTPTNNIYLMLPFYNKDAVIIDGEVFTEEDYKQGNKVCLVSRKLARRNNLGVGDPLHLRLRTANYAQAAGVGLDSEMSGGVGLLNAKGEVYPIFEESDYQIVGIYDMIPGSSLKREYMLEENEVIIPTASVKNSDENNIICYGPMKGSTTSFQIPNGSIDEFMEIWNKQGITNLEIQFYDKGYSKLEEGLNQMKKISVAMLITGLITAVFILLFFCHMIITKQMKRTAIERSLGMTKRQCIWSLLSGIVLIALIGCMVGSISGTLLTQKAVQKMTDISRYQQDYSDGQFDETGADAEQAIVVSKADCLTVSAEIGFALLLAAAAVSVIYIRRNLKKEPLELLSGNQ